MKLIKTLFITMVIMFAFANVGQARHIVGGDVVYNCLGVDTINNTITLEVIFTMYRDAAGNGANFDPDADFGIFRGSENNWTYISSVVQQAPTSVSPVQNVGTNPCLIIPPNIRVEQGIYNFQVTLPIIQESYLIAYQRCCRNVTINNINQPDETGAAFTVEISPTAQASCNNSPKFNNFPPIVICLGERVDFDHSATDAEGDQLVYEFCAPLQAGGQDGVNGGDARSCTGVRPDPQRCAPPFQEVSFRLPTYSAVNPLGGNPRVDISSETGFISGIPTVEGQFVVGVCVKEFRNGELIGTLRRDFQFNVAQCEQTVVAEVAADAVINGQEFLINSCGENTLTFENESFEIQNIQSYYWEFVSGETELTSIERDATITFPGVGQYDGTMIINRGTECADTAMISVTIFPSIDADYSFDYDTCVAGEVMFVDESMSDAGPIVAWEWDFGDGGTANVAQPDYQYAEPGDYMTRVIVTDDNECKDSLTQMVRWKPVPSLIIVEPTTFIGCKPANIFFNNLSTPIDETYIIEWDFGDGGKSDEISPTYDYQETGTYDVRVDITSPIGCTTSRTFPDWITIKESPMADFVFSPERPTSFQKEITFTNLSEGGVGYLWQFDTVGISLDRDPVFRFPDTGRYVVDLVVVNEESCTDTMRQVIDISPFSSYFLPNAFTPNNDASNDEFIGAGIAEGISDFQMKVFSRWGEEVFSTTNPSVGWNGRKNNSGENSPTGVYVYVVEFFTPRGEPVVRRGHVTLIR